MRNDKKLAIGGCLTKFILELNLVMNAHLIRNEHSYTVGENLLCSPVAGNFQSRTFLKTAVEALFCTLRSSNIADGANEF